MIKRDVLGQLLSKDLDGDNHIPNSRLQNGRPQSNEWRHGYAQVLHVYVVKSWLKIICQSYDEQKGQTDEFCDFMRNS